MSPFVISQLETFEGGWTVVEVGFDQYKHFNFEGKTNQPINTTLVLTYYPTESSTAGGPSEVKYPLIVFKGSNQETVGQWFYPPTKDGKARRDADLHYINDLVAMRCPNAVR